MDGATVQEFMRKEDVEYDEDRFRRRVMKELDEIREQIDEGIERQLTDKWAHDGEYIVRFAARGELRKERRAARREKVGRSFGKGDY